MLCSCDVAGQVISGYRVQQGRYEMIGKGNPQWPEVYECVKLARVASFNFDCLSCHITLHIEYPFNVIKIIC